jgi:hypothetical protein
MGRGRTARAIPFALGLLLALLVRALVVWVLEEPLSSP